MALTETEIHWGEDRICTVCAEMLPAGATAYEDEDGTLCCFCAEPEIAAYGTHADLPGADADMVFALLDASMEGITS